MQISYLLHPKAPQFHQYGLMRYAYIPHTMAVLTFLQVHIIYCRKCLLPFSYTNKSVFGSTFIDTLRPAWGTLIFALGLGAQALFVAVVLSQLRLKLLWAFPIVSHLHLAAIYTNVFRIPQNPSDKIYKRLRLWVCMSWITSVISLVLLILVIFDLADWPAAGQCLLCVSLVGVQARRGRVKACCVLTLSLT